MGEGVYPGCGLVQLGGPADGRDDSTLAHVLPLASRRKIEKLVEE